MRLDLKKLSETAIIPKQGRVGDAGLDLFTDEEVVLLPKQKKIIKTNIAIKLDINQGAFVMGRSGNTAKGVPNCLILTDVDYENQKVTFSEEEHRADITVFLGLIDSNYIGNIGIMVKNEENLAIKIPKHTKLAQLVVFNPNQVSFTEVAELEETNRGESGYGSSDNL